MCFVCVDDVEWEQLDWGELGWVVRPANVPDASQLCVLDVRLGAGKGHDFHRHPNQEEIIFVRSGIVEQWVRDECTILMAGDTCFIPKGDVHATFVDAGAAAPAHLLVVLGPSHGLAGYEAVDVSSDEPWASLRSSYPITTPPPGESVIQHTVTFRLNADADADAFFQRARALRSIEGVHAFEVLRQVGQKNDFTHGLTMNFADQAAYDGYNNHPEHQSFVHDVWLPNVADFLELDYVREAD